MLRAIIGGTDITALGYFEQEYSQITDQIQNKANVYQFKINQNAFPTLPSDDNLWAHYMFDEGAGTVLVDISGNDYNGTENGPTYSTAGIVNQSLNFSGTQYVTLPSSALPTEEITVSIWARVSDFTAVRRMIWNNWAAAGDWIIYSDTTNWVFGIRDATNTQQLVTTPHNSDSSKFHHLVGTYDGATQRFYVDGVMVASTNSFAVALTTGGTFQMGSSSTNPMAGNLDECRIYTTAISQANVSALFQYPAAVFATGAIDVQPNDLVTIYDSVQIVSLSGTTLTVYDKTLSGVSILTFNKYQAGMTMWLGVGLPTLEGIEIASVAQGSTAGQVVITLAADAINSHYANEWAGKIAFAGFVLDVSETNPKQLFNTESLVNCVDFTKLFDAKLINNQWSQVDARYIINDFVNGFVNYNAGIDSMDDGTAWSHAGDGGTPTNPAPTNPVSVGTTQFPWTHSGGTATFTDSGLPTLNLSFFTGVASGAPTGGNLTFWYNNAIGVTNIKFKIGSSSSNYIEFTFVPNATITGFYFVSLEAVNATVVGTPNWMAQNYVQLIVAETATGSIQISDLRFTATGSFTMYNVQQTEILAASSLPGETETVAVVAAFRKATQFLQDLADMCAYYWKIDYERDIHFFAIDTVVAPFSINDTSDNFEKLTVKVDTSQLKNRQTVQGGSYVADTTFSETTPETDNSTRSWNTTYQFSNPVVFLDNDSTTKTATTGTTTTNVNITSHGLTAGQYVTNRSVTGGPVVRVVRTVVDANNFTVDAVPSQASGNTFSYFATPVTVAEIGVDAENSATLMWDGASQSIRLSLDQTTYPAGYYLLFTYNPLYPVLVQVSDPVSIAAMQALLGGDGTFDGDLINDENITQQQAQARAQGEVDTYGNPIITITFTTNYEGLVAGQVIPIQDTYRNIDDNYLIQIVKTKYVQDLPYFTVTCASTLFGLVELLQKIFAMSSGLQLAQGTTITPIISESPEISVTDYNYFPSGGTYFQGNDTVTVVDVTNQFTTVGNTTGIWQPSSTVTKWGECLWG